MKESLKRRLIKEYFLAPLPLPSKKSGFVLLLSIVLAGFLSTSTGPDLSGFVFTLGMLYALVFPFGKAQRHPEHGNLHISCGLIRHWIAQIRYRKRPSYQQMLQWLHEDIDNIVRESSNALDIVTPTRSPIVLIGPHYWLTRGLNAHDILRHYETDKELYFYSTYTITVFQFTERFFGVYQTVYNMLKHTHVSTETRELFYRDVVEVVVRSDASNYSLKEGERLEHAKAFALTVSSGDAIRVLINDPVLVKAGQDIESMGESAVRNIRAMLRDYKS